MPGSSSPTKRNPASSALAMEASQTFSVADVSLSIGALRLFLAREQRTAGHPVAGMAKSMGPRADFADEGLTSASGPKLTL